MQSCGNLALGRSHSSSSVGVHVVKKGWLDSKHDTVRVTELKSYVKSNEQLRTGDKQESVRRAKDTALPVVFNSKDWPPSADSVTQPGCEVRDSCLIGASSQYFTEYWHKRV